MMVITSVPPSPQVLVGGAGAGVRVMAGVPGGPISGRRGAAESVKRELPSAEQSRVFSLIDSSASVAVLFSPPPGTGPAAAPLIVRAGKAGGAVRRGGAE